MPIERTEEENPPTLEDNRMPADAVDPYGLLYRPDPDVKFNHEVPLLFGDRNFSLETFRKSSTFGCRNAKNVWLLSCENRGIFRNFQKTGLDRKKLRVILESFPGEV